MYPIHTITTVKHIMLKPFYDFGLILWGYFLAFINLDVEKPPLTKSVLSDFMLYLTIVLTVIKIYQLLKNEFGKRKK